MVRSWQFGLSNNENTKRTTLKLKKNMKTTSKFSIKVFAFAFAALFTFNFAANANVDGIDRATRKARAAVKEASPNDWRTFAESAEACINKRVNMREAAKWISSSKAIKVTSYNTMVEADYYWAIGMMDKALETYLEALKVGNTEENFDPKEVQDRIAKIKGLDW